MSDKTSIEKTHGPDILTILGRRKLNLPDTFIRSGWEVVEPDGLLVFMNDFHIKTTGKNKGKKAWGKNRQRTFVTQQEIEAEELAWEKETGKCHKCGGDGQEWTGWHHINGDSYRTCTRCDGDGITPNADKT